MTHLKVIYVEWLDSETEQGWGAADDGAEEIKLTYSTGIFVYETTDYLLLAHSFDPDTAEYNGRIRIPQVAIKKARTLCQIQVKD